MDLTLGQQLVTRRKSTPIMMIITRPTAATFSPQLALVVPLDPAIEVFVSYPLEYD